MELNEMLEELKKKFAAKDAQIEAMKKHEVELRYERDQLLKTKTKLENQITENNVKLDKIQKAVGDLK